MKKTVLILIVTLISVFGFGQKIKVKKTEIFVNETIIGKAIVLKKGEKYDFQDVNGNHLFFGNYYTKQIKGTDEKVNYIEIKINENDEPTSFNTVVEMNEISIASFSFENSRDIVFQLFKKGFVSEESGFDMAQITAFASSKGKADLAKSSAIQRNPTDIGTNSKSDGTGTSIEILENLIEEPAIFTIEGVEYNGLATIIFSKLSMDDELKLDNADYRIKNYVKDLKEEEYGARAILNYFETDRDNKENEKLVKVKSRGGFSINVMKKSGVTLNFESYEFDDNNLINEGMNLLGAFTKDKKDANTAATLDTKSREEIVFFNVVSDFDGIKILQDPVTNTIAVKTLNSKVVMSINDIFLGSYLPKNLKRYLNCKSLNNDIDNLKSITDLENLLKKYQQECK